MQPAPAPPGRAPALPRLGLVVALLAALLGAKHYRDAEAARRRQELALKSLGNEGLFLFSSLDTDNDLYISPEEFKPIAEKLTGIAPVSGAEEEEVLDPKGETLSVVARFQPLLMETMTKSKDGFLGISHIALSGLRNWTAPATPVSVMFAQQFKAFLPPKHKTELADPWWVIPSELNIFTGYLPNNRFYPPAPRGKEIVIHKLLSMFHPRPFVKTRFAPQGTVACIQAVAEFYYKIAFRIHAEFQLNEPPSFPFWFSPAQFTGYVILSKDSSHVRELKLFVPNNRSLNVDMEWLYGALESSNMEVDIGYLPQVSYLPFTQAFERARAESKLVHSILLWGALDDQSWSGRTLRETVLESSPILAFLNQSFISTWSLVKELEELQAKRENEVNSKLADLHLEKYNFPVEIMICLPNGTVVHHINANYFLDITSVKPEEVESSIFGFSAGFEDPSTATYLQFLKEGLQRAKPFLQP
ncbi:hypothetical protein lerEdw1_009488 [Lerista edwardsae]|nr:hypothetical protein lerEdw1_009488 [Lerista edwardsae]